MQCVRRRNARSQGQRGVARGRIPTVSLSRAGSPRRRPALGVRGDNQRRAGCVAQRRWRRSPQEVRRASGRGSRQTSSDARSPRARPEDRARQADAHHPSRDVVPRVSESPPPAPRWPVWPRRAESSTTSSVSEGRTAFRRGLEDVEQLDRPRERPTSAPAQLRATTAAERRGEVSGTKDRVHAPGEQQSLPA